MQQNRIVQIISTGLPPEEGIGVYAWELSRFLTSRNREVTLICRTTEKKGKIENRGGVTVVNLPAPGGYPFQAEFYAAEVRHYIGKMDDNIGLVQVHTPLVSAVRIQLPVVTTIHTPIAADVARYEMRGASAWLSRFQSPFSWIAEDLLLRHSSVVTTVSHTASHETTLSHPWIRCPKVLGNAVDPSVFRPSDAECGGRPLVLYKGRFAPRKGPFEFLKAAELLLAQGIDADFELSGAGPLEVALRTYVNRRNLGHRIALTPVTPREEVPQAYAKASVYVTPARYEGLPTAVLEAMSCELPVVASRIDAHSELITDGVEGRLVPVGNSAAMASAIRVYAEDSSLARRSGEAGRARILAHFTWDVLGQRFLSLYDSLG